MVKSAGKKISLRGINRLLYKKMGRAISDYQMLNPNDRVLVAVSGGIDSLSMLKLFELRQKSIPISFNILACFIDTGFIHVDRQGFFDFINSCGFKLISRSLKLDSGFDCFWCSWNRRKLLFETARRYDCNKIALGHNIDDIAETTLMNLLFRGEISSSVPALSMFEGKTTLIRPMCYIEKDEINEFASYWNLSRKAGDCPYHGNGQRAAVRKIIQDLEKDCRFVKKNIFRSLRRIRKDYLL